MVFRENDFDHAAPPAVTIHLANEGEDELRSDLDDRLKAISRGTEGETLQALTVMGACVATKDSSSQTEYFHYPTRAAIFSSVDQVMRNASSCPTITDEEIFKSVRRRADLRQVPSDFLRGVIYSETATINMKEASKDLGVGVVATHE